jgi:chitodextrinase
MWGAAPRLRWFVVCTVACLALLAPGLGAARVDAAAADATFADVPESNPFFAEIEQLFARGITNGCGVNSSGQRVFCPLQNVTRQEMAVFVNRGKALALLRPATATFADVPTTHPFYAHIERFVADGITNGCGVNSASKRIYCPLQNVTRQEMAVFLMRARGLSALTPATPTFADVPTTHPFYGQIERFADEGIASGCGTNSAGQPIFCPLQQVTRQEVAGFLIRTFPTAIPDTSAPTAPTGLTLVSRTQTSITLAWTGALDNFAVTGYGAYVNGVLAGTTTSTSFTFTGLNCGTLHPLTVDAFDLAGNRSSRTLMHVSTNACQVDTQPPNVPQGLHTASKSQTTVTLAWDATTDNQGVVGYHLYRDNVRVASTPNLTYTFTGLVCGTLYALALEAYDAAGNVSYRPQAVAMVSTNACNADTQAPTAPTGVAASGITSSSVTLSWTASTDNVGVTGYGRYSNGSLVGEGTGTSFTFTGLTCNTSYTLGVDAHDAAGNRSTRPQVSASTSACPPPPPPPPPGAANLWIDTNGGSCTRQATAGSYSDAQACASFAAAYGAAASADLVRIRAGSYGAQFFAGGVGSSQPRGTKTLTFIGEPGNVIRQIHFGSSGLVFDGIRIDAGGTKTSGAAFENSGGSFLFKNGSIGNVLDEKGAMLNGPNMMFDNVLFHDVVIRGAGVHLECIMALWNQGMVIRNSTFRNCGIMSASIGIGDFWSNPPPPYSHVTLENNYWGTSRTENSSCCAAYTLALWATKVPVGSDYGVLDNWRIVRNHFEAGSGVIVRPRDNGTSVICGNTGSVPNSTWARACP